MQTLGTNKSCNLLEQKNQAASPDNLSAKKSRNLLGQKITQPLGTKQTANLLKQKNHATSWVQKITQPLGTKKIAQPLKTKKIMFSLGPIASKLVHKALNCSKWHQICPNRLE